MPPPGHEPFLSAICTNPEDDTVRLVYADWLDENGDPERAEFIRLQIGLLREPAEYPPRRSRFRLNELLQQNLDRWIAELPQLPDLSWPHEFTRGFVEAIRANSGKQFVEHREQVFRSAPVRSLTLYDASAAVLAQVVAVPEMERLTALYLRQCRVPAGQLNVLTHCPRLTNLRTLAISGRQVGNRVRSITTAEARALVKSPHLPALETIYFGDGITREAAEILRTRYKLG